MLTSAVACCRPGVWGPAGDARGDADGDAWGHTVKSLLESLSSITVSACVMYPVRHSSSLLQTCRIAAPKGVTLAAPDLTHHAGSTVRVGHSPVQPSVTAVQKLVNGSFSLPNLAKTTMTAPRQDTAGL